MRKLLPVLLLLTFVACKKKNEGHSYYLTAKAGSYQFFSTGALLTTDKSVWTTAPVLEIAGTTGVQAALKLQLVGYTGALDTFQLDSMQSYATYLPPIPSVQVYAVHGTVIITESTPDVKGTFNFTCNDSTKVAGNFIIAPL